MRLRCTKRKGFSVVLHAKNTCRVAPSATRSYFHQLSQWVDWHIQMTETASTFVWVSHAQAIGDQSRAAVHPFPELPVLPSGPFHIWMRVIRL